MSNRVILIVKRVVIAFDFIIWWIVAFTLLRTLGLVSDVLQRVPF